mmetsp:Transcript_3417/g.4787  ORF Transcript_3417/g.4787 Transcript_3417/m.4787 type:complete len:211 (+) Transcript_3417:140-772(+)
MSDRNEYDFLFKVLMIGDSASGKSSMLLRFSDNSFFESHICTIGVDFKIRSLHLDDNKIAKLQIWDTAGQERFRTITHTYYRHAGAVIIVFDLSNRTSFNSLPMWVQEARRFAPKHVQIILVGNKLDLAASRQITMDEAREFAASQGFDYLETSAKMNTNIDNLFHLAANKLRANHNEILKERAREKHKLDIRRGHRIAAQDQSGGGCIC